MFKLSKKTEYCLLVLRHLARQADEVWTVRDLARECRVPQPLLAKLMQQLARRDLVRSVQGLRGGYRLNRDLSQISLAEVVESVDGPISLTSCKQDDDRCERHSFCDLKTAIAPVQRQMRQYLQEVKVSDL
jgi:Rrf2 family protein